MFWIHSLKLTASSPLKIGTPWKSGDSELGNHHFQVQTCNFGFREDILSVSCQFRNFNQKASGKRWSLPQNESVLKGRSVPNARWIGLIEWRILYLKIQQLNQMGVSKNRGGPPKSSILIGFSTVNHPFWGYPYFWKHPDSQQQTWILVSITSMWPVWKYHEPQLGFTTSPSFHDPPSMVVSGSPKRW